MPSTDAFSPAPSVAESSTFSVDRWLFASARIFVACWVIFYLIRGASMALWFDGAPGDGPFQVFNPLRRIAAGQVGGLDFVFYHGIGVPYLHYPLFALFGGKTIAASELSRQWMSSLAFVLSLLAFTRAALGRTKRIWVALAAMLMAIEAVFPLAASPALSQVAIRATMPVFLFTALLLPIGELSKAIVTGICLGLALPFGTEHGIALGLAFCFVSIAVVVREAFFGRAGVTGRWENIRFILIVLCAAVGTAAYTLWLICGAEGARQAMRYALVELPSDKFWFDGTPPNPYLGAWSDLLKSRHFIVPLLPACVALALLLALFPRFWAKPMRLSKDWEPLAILMLVYGILSCVPLLGYFSKHYVIPITRVLVMVGLLLFIKLEAHPLRKAFQTIRTARGQLFAKWGFSALCLIVSGALTVASATTVTRFVRHWQSGSFTFSKLVNQSWDTFMTRATRLIDERRGAGPPSLWSTYSGLLESHYGIFTPAEDYITLSAGGQRRRRYVDEFRSLQPRIVQTMASSYSAYEEWLQNVRWDFYEDLLDNYEPLGQIGHAIFWERKSQAWVAPSIGFETVPLDPGGQSVTLTSNDRQDRLGVVQVHYTIQNPWKRLPFLGLTPRYFAMLEGTPRNNPVSFPPYEAEFRFPLFLPPDSVVRMHFVTRSLLPGAAFRVESVELKKLPFMRSQEIVTRAHH
jgi:hypothetical protein